MTKFIDMLFKHMSDESEMDSFVSRSSDTTIPLSEAVESALEQLQANKPHVAPKIAPMPAKALAAVLLNSSSVAPADLSRRSYVTVLRVPAGGANMVVKFLVDVLEDATNNHYDGNVGILVMAIGTRRADHIDTAMLSGAGVILVVEPDTVLDKSIKKFVDREISVSEPDTGDVNEVVRLVTGNRIQFPVRDYTVPDVLAAVRVGSTVNDIGRRLNRAMDSFDAEDSNDGSDVIAATEKKSNPIVKLEDLTGYGQAKDWGMQLAHDLSEYRDGVLDFDELDKGVLLKGLPGTGKTYFASALAAQCGVELVPISYHDWAGDTGGRGDSVAASLNKMFTAWRKRASRTNPIIVFIDEADSMGRRGGNAHNDSWFTPQINAWLAFLDGAIPREGIVVIAATNHVDRVDPALLRPGRLETVIELPAPTVESLEGVIRHHLPANADLSDLRAAARACRGKTPAEVAMMVRHAKRMARLCRRTVCADDVYVLARHGRPLEKDDDICCVHESGHALAAVIYGVGLDHVDADAALTKISPVTLLRPSSLVADIRISLAGRAAEELIFDVASSGGFGDLESATKAALSYHGHFGFGQAGLFYCGPDIARYGDIRNAASDMLVKEYEVVKEDIRQRLPALKRLAKRLAKERYLTGSEVKDCVQPTVFDMRLPDKSTSWSAPSDDERSPAGNRWRMAA